MIVFDNTYFTYDGKPLISGFSLCIASGEKTVLYGPSGGGKSTLIHAILGFVHPTQGKVEIGGEAVNDRNIGAIRTLTAWLPQDLSLPAMSVKQLIETPFSFQTNRHLLPSTERIYEVFNSLGLEHTLLEKTSDQLSGGQRQRIMLASTTLLHKPILLLDEPTSALDPKSVILTIEYLKSLTDTTMVAISHDPSFIDAFDRKILIH